MVAQLKRDVEALAGEGGRPVGSEGHRRARSYLADRLGSLGLTPLRAGSFDLPYRSADGLGPGGQFVNLAGKLPGRRPDLEPVVLMAHYDTCGSTPGADDNAAAVAILLSVVGPLRAGRPGRDLWFVFPDAEEPPHFLGPDMGSTRFYTEQRRPGEEVACAVVLDLCGHDVALPGLADLLAVVGAETSAGLACAVAALGPTPAPGVRVVPVQTRHIGDLSDYHVFREHGLPYLFLTCGEWAHYHGAGDTPEKLNYAKMAGISAYLVRLVETLARPGDAGPAAGCTGPVDTTELELRFLREVLGPLAAGLRTREDIDQLVGSLRERIYRW